MKRKVKIFKDGINVGWAKTDYGAINNILNTSKQWGFDISAYTVVDYDTYEVLWRGMDYINKQAQEQP